MEGGNGTDRNGKKQITASIGGGVGGIGVVVLWGGALAAATLISAFTIKRCRGKPTNRDQSVDRYVSKKLKKEDSEGEESGGLLQTSSPSLRFHHGSDGTSQTDVTQIDSFKLVSTQSLSLEEKAVLEINGAKETVACADQEILLPENRPIFYNNGTTEKEFTFPVFNIPLLQEMDMDKNDSGKDPVSIEAIEVKQEDEACQTVLVEKIKEDPPMQSVEEDLDVDVDAEEGGEYVLENPPMQSVEDVDDDEGRYVEEKGEQSSDGMEDSSMESIAEPISPTESIERLKIDFQHSGETIEDTLASLDANEVKKEDEACETVQVEQIEEDPPLRSVEEEDEEGDVDVEEEGEYVVEKGEESSDRTGDSSMGSNAEPIWPTESIEISPVEFKEMKINSQNSVEKIEEEEEDSNNRGNIRSFEFLSTQSLFLAQEEKQPTLEIIGEKETILCADQEILLSENSELQIIQSHDNYGNNIKEFTLPVFQLGLDLNENDSDEDTPSVETIEEKGINTKEFTSPVFPLGLDMNKNDSDEDTPSIEAIKEKKEDETCETGHVVSMQSIEIEDDEDVHVHVEEGEYFVENGEESSEGTGDSSMESSAEESSEGTGDSSTESNAEPIWPTESIERLSVMKIREEDGVIKKEDDSYNSSCENSSTNDVGKNNSEVTGKSVMILNKGETSELVMANDRPANSAKLRIWVWSVWVLVLLLLLLSLAYHEAVSCYLLDRDSFTA
ncbi:hypothetical protein L1049_004413 [Liquidambar formosana]|uniref:Uncharacterized protein n=1 Tax=Liquidambar formosana TaxID=63359 RepID=A0AAP0RTB7_LIQFO